MERSPPQQPGAAVEPGKTIVDALLADDTRFLNSVQVGRNLSRNPHHCSPKTVATRARQRGKLFGAWDGRAYRYPTFQFDAKGQLRPMVAALIAALPRDSDGSGRDAALWMHAPDAALAGKTPAVVFAEEPNRVIELARRRQDGAPDAD